MTLSSYAPNWSAYVAFWDEVDDWRPCLVTKGPNEGLKVPKYLVAPVNKGNFASVLR